MSKLLEKKRAFALIEVFNAFVFAISNQREILRVQLWPIIVSFAGYMVLVFGLYLSPNAPLDLKKLPADIEEISSVIASIFPDAKKKPDMQFDANGNFVHNPDGYVTHDEGKRFNYDLIKEMNRINMFAAISWLILLVAGVMSTVRYYRYMILGEGEGEGGTPRFSFGARESGVLGYALLVGLLVLICIIFVTILMVAASYPIIMLFIIYAPKVLSFFAAIGYVFFSIFIALFMLRFAFVFPSVSCGHKSGFIQSWRQMRGQYISFFFAMIVFTCLSIALAWLLIVVPVSLFYSSGVGAVLDNVYVRGLLTALFSTYYIWVTYVLGGARAALISRYYSFALEKAKK